MPETFMTDAARQELALREAVRTGNRHMRRKGKKLLRDVPPPRPWYVFEHPVVGTVGVRPAASGASLEMRLPAGLEGEERDGVIAWAVEELKKHAAEVAAQKYSAE